MLRALYNILPAAGVMPDETEILALLPELAVLKETQQDPRWHPEGSVWEHTRMVVECLVGLPDYAQASQQERFALFYAALLHDIGKAGTTEEQPDGQITSYGHARKGAIYARQLLWKRNVPFDSRELICSLIENHMQVVHSFEDRNGLRPEFIAHRLSWELPKVRLLCVLAEADTRGRGGELRRDSLDTIELFRELAGEEGCLDRPKSFPDPHTRLQYVRSKGAIHLESPYYHQKGSNVIMLSGLPAAGKDTWCREEQPDLPVVSFDGARAELGLAHGKNDGRASQHVYQAAKVLLRADKPFIWNATFLSRQMRSKVLALLYAYGANVEIVYLESPEPVLRRRNRERSASLPDEAIDRLLRQWEIPKAHEAHAVRFVVSQGYERFC